MLVLCTFWQQKLADTATAVAAETPLQEHDGFERARIVSDLALFYPFVPGMPRASTPSSDRVPSAASASSGQRLKRERSSEGKEKGKSAEDIGMYLDQFLEDVSDLPSELQVIFES